MTKAIQIVMIMPAIILRYTAAEVRVSRFYHSKLKLIEQNTNFTVLYIGINASALSELFLYYFDHIHIIIICSI